jgi:hypothetical protein
MLAVLCMWSTVPLSIRARHVKCLVWSKVDDKLLSRRKVAILGSENLILNF